MAFLFYLSIIDLFEKYQFIDLIYPGQDISRQEIGDLKFSLNSHSYRYTLLFAQKKEIMNRIQKNNYLTDSIDTELIDLWSKLDHQPKVIVCKYYSKIYKYYTISYF